jgi:hypothetical protein
MSLELGALLAHFSDRVLALEANTPLVGSFASYGGRVSNSNPSAITDLFDVPVPWVNAQATLSEGGAQQEFFHYPLADSVFYYPPSIRTDTYHFRSFTTGRSFMFTYPNTLDSTKVLMLSGGVEQRGFRINNFGFYSSFLYLDEDSQRRRNDLISHLRPKSYFLAFAHNVARSLGDFNAVHVRRGDFKRLPGISTARRSPDEVLTRLDSNFPRSQKLALLTDEISDHFFDPILAYYPDIIVLDEYILNEHGGAFHQLPHHDSVALALIAQLVASESKEFIGSMKSTYTAMIQRARGNAGKKERFKFLWNEVLPTDNPHYRTRSLIGNIPTLLPNGEMQEQFDGPYSWNRYGPFVNNAWTREWPESFTFTDHFAG